MAKYNLDQNQRSISGNIQPHAPLQSVNKAAHSDFEMQRRHHQKSKTGVSVAPQKEPYVLQIFFKKLGQNLRGTHDISRLRKAEGSRDICTNVRQSPRVEVPCSE